MSKPLKVLSLGAGVQSSALALMAEAGEIEKPDVAIFADTQDEPKSVMNWLNRLEPMLSFPVIRASRGCLSEDFLAALKGETNRCGQPPYYVRNAENDGTPAAVSGGMLWRQCTREYKLDVIRREVRKQMEERGLSKVRQIIGISADEAHRMKDSGVRYIENEYPLVDSRISRGECSEWIKNKGLPIPPKSACYHCPYRSNRGWLDMKRNQPEEFERAASYDERLRSIQRSSKVNGANIKGELFLHRKMIPLREAVEMDDQQRDFDFDGFGNECEGMCGL